MRQVIVRVPASTSNLGPGFDCLGVAVRIYNRITVTRGLRWRPPPIVSNAAKLFFQHSSSRRFPFFCSIREEIPRGRGLGSSATIRLGVLHGLNELSGRPLDSVAIFQLGAELEGHPDNAASGSFGGFTVTRRGDRVSRSRGRRQGHFALQRFDVSSRVYFIFLIPDLEIATAAARKVLPATIPRIAAVENSQRACAITAAFASGNYEDLRGAFADRLHQPFRKRLMPFLPRVIAAAENAGALGAFLSGSGSSICAISLGHERRIAVAMERVAKLRTARIIITTADNSGVSIRRLPASNS